MAFPGHVIKKIKVSYYIFSFDSFMCIRGYDQEIGPINLQYRFIVFFFSYSYKNKCMNNTTQRLIAWNFSGASRHKVVALSSPLLF